MRKRKKYHKGKRHEIYLQHEWTKVEVESDIEEKLYLSVSLLFCVFPLLLHELWVKFSLHASSSTYLCDDVKTHHISETKMFQCFTAAMRCKTNIILSEASKWDSASFICCSLLTKQEYEYFSLEFYIQCMQCPT